MVFEIYDSQDTDMSHFDGDETDLNNTEKSEFDDEDKILY